MLRNVIVGLLVFVVPSAGVYSCANLICQHRADYAGSITFIGRSQNVFGSVYTRVHMWRDPADTTPLPDVTVHVDGAKYRLDSFTTELVQGLGAGPEQGNLVDDNENVFRYRLTNGKLSYFCFENASRPGKPASKGNVSSVALAFGERQPFTMPITHRHLLHSAGKPDRTYLNFAQ